MAALQEYHRQQYKRILVPLDGSGWSERVIPRAAEIARENDAELVLLHVFQEPAREFVGDIALAGQESQIDQVREQMKNHFKGLRNELRREQLDVRLHWIEGAGVARQICDYVSGEDVDLVVMATHGRNGLARALYGSIAKDVMNRAKSQVMLVLS